MEPGAPTFLQACEREDAHPFSKGQGVISGELDLARRMLRVGGKEGTIETQ